MNYSTLDDQTLIHHISRAESDALSELYQRYHRLVFSIAFNTVSDRAIAEEVTLDVFTNVWLKADSYRPDRAKVSTWLSSMTRHRSIDQLRRRKVRLDHNSVSWTNLGEESIPHADSHPEHATELALQRERVRHAVRQLPLEQREILELAYFGGHSQSQIAKTLNQPLGTVKTRVRLAMKKLRTLLIDEI